MIPTIIFKFDGEKYELPLYLKNIEIQCPHEDVTEIEIKAISFNKYELENWGRLIAQLGHRRKNA